METSKAGELPASLAVGYAVTAVAFVYATVVAVMIAFGVFKDKEGGTATARLTQTQGSE